ncbi:MAG: toll/interleukin-1 receptor domain-containing protein [Prevotellaceae bacterium]|jgi:hypothetical protein|nr:toll/interleukin-1 receptor domain-containing protein [Prevotellaceae bacterium]
MDTIETIPVVFISYSHDNESHKNWVLRLATRLRENGVDILLDRWNTRLGSDIAAFMEKGLSKSNRVICICTDIYVKKANEGRGGAGYEKQIISAEYLENQNTELVIPLIRNKEHLVPTFLRGRMYIDFSDEALYETKYEELLREILDEQILPIPPIGKNPFKNIKDFTQQKFIPSNEKYLSPAPRGNVTFDYSNNNGRYTIGQNEFMFELAFSKSSNRSIYIYNDPQSINTVALVKDVTEIYLIKDARHYDASSRVRCPQINQIGVLQNKNGFYAAIKILNIKDDTRGAVNDEITFSYVIQTNGSPDFTKSEEKE